MTGLPRHPRGPDERHPGVDTDAMSPAKKPRLHESESTMDYELSDYNMAPEGPNGYLAGPDDFGQQVPTLATEGEQGGTLPSRSPFQQVIFLDGASVPFAGPKDDAAVPLAESDADAAEPSTEPCLPCIPPTATDVQDHLAEIKAALGNVQRKVHALEQKKLCTAAELESLRAENEALRAQIKQDNEQEQAPMSQPLKAKLDTSSTGFHNNEADGDNSDAPPDIWQAPSVHGLLSRLSSLIEENADHQVDIAGLQADLETKKKVINDLGAKLHRLQNAESSVPKGEVLGCFTQLKHAIHNLAQFKFSGHPLIKSMNKEQRSTFETLAENFEELIKDEDAKGQFFEGAIWKLVLNEFLSGPGQAYHKKMGQALKEIEEDLFSAAVKLEDPDETVEVYKSFRIQAGYFMDKFHRSFPRRGFNRRANFPASLADLLVKYSSNSNAEELMENFRDVVDRAVDLAKLMARSKDLYVCCMAAGIGGSETYGFKFDKRTMMAELELYRKSVKARDVDFVIAPALFRIEGANGRLEVEEKMAVSA